MEAQDITAVLPSRETADCHASSISQGSGTQRDFAAMIWFLDARGAVLRVDDMIPSPASAHCVTCVARFPCLASTWKAFALWCHNDRVVMGASCLRLRQLWCVQAPAQSGADRCQRPRFCRSDIIRICCYLGLAEDGCWQGNGTAAALWCEKRDCSCPGRICRPSSWWVCRHLGSKPNWREWRRFTARILHSLPLCWMGPWLLGETPSNGGDSSMVQDRLQGIVNVQGNPYAFAAVTEEGSLVTWGKATLGGDSSVIRESPASHTLFERVLCQCWRMSSSYMGLPKRLQQCATMDPLLHGERRTEAGTAPQCNLRLPLSSCSGH